MASKLDFSIGEMVLVKNREDLYPNGLTTMTGEIIGLQKEGDWGVLVKFNGWQYGHDGSGNYGKEIHDLYWCCCDDIIKTNFDIGL